MPEVAVAGLAGARDGFAAVPAEEDDAFSLLADAVLSNAEFDARAAPEAEAEAEAEAVETDLRMLPVGENTC